MPPLPLPLARRPGPLAAVPLTLFVCASAGCGASTGAAGRAPVAPVPAAAAASSAAPTALGSAAAAPVPPAAPALPGSPGSTPAPGSAAGPASPGAAAFSPAHPLRATVQAFGGTLMVEVRDLPSEPANAAIQAAVSEIGEVERLTDPGRPDSEVAALNAGAGKGARRIDPRLVPVLARALDFCQWSDGKEGPLGRDLHRLWGRGGTPLDAPPPAGLLDQAAAAAACKHLTLDLAKRTATLDAGSALDLVDFSTGMAVDRAIDLLRQHGSANAFVQLRNVRRGIGPGGDGRGWMIDLPAFGGLLEPLGRIFLRDQSLAMAARDERPLSVGGQPLAAFINQSTGQPAGEGVFAVLTVTDLATDAQALAATMFLTGAPEGEILTGSIRPRPSILWLMGSGNGPPLLVDYRWTEVAKR
jgi:thiamine biosynthesis lipoprotein